MIGRRFGPYEITGHLGSGGMGDVYRATDARLGRDVAIKVLSDALSGDPHRLARFDREARALGALNHQNIGSIYGIEDADSRRGLVLELVEGPTLGDVIQGIAHGDLPVLSLADAVSIFRQIADALEAAHDRGIVHRDLKPANIKLTPSGVVKVLDFGLAKACDGPPQGDAESTTTIPPNLTGTGLIVGTPRYMSPEQARGATVGVQTDVWAFGCVVFEVLTGRPAFDARTVADSISAVLTHEPEWNRLPVATPPALRRLLRRCLQKDPRKRLRHIGDAKLDLDDALAEPEAPATAAVARSIEVRRLTDSFGLKEGPAISPDGKMVAFSTMVNGHRQIYIQLIAGGAPLQITRDAVDHDEPRWDPDSSRLIFHSPARSPKETGSICEIPALGGAPRRVTPALNGGDISHDGKQLALFRKGGDRFELMVCCRDGSAARVVATLPAGIHAYWSPRWSPDDKAIAFGATSLQFETQLLVVSVDGGEPARVARADGIRGHTWRPDSSGLIYSSSRGSTMPYPPSHNLRTVNLDGSEDRAITFGDASYTEPDAGTSGRLVASRARSRSDIWSFPVDGSPAENTARGRQITRQTGQVQAPSVSPDGVEVAYVSDHGGHSNVWICGLDGSGPRQTTFEDDPDTLVGIAQWSPRGDLLAFIVARFGQLEVRLVDPDGSNQRLLLADAFGAYWSGDGTGVYCCRNTGQVVRIEADSGEMTVIRSDNALGPSITADGRTLFYSTRLPTDPLRTRANWELRRASPPDGPSELIATIDGARLPLSPRLTPHYAISPDSEWLAVPLTNGATTNLWTFPARGGVPRQVTDFGDRPILIARWASWTPDGTQLVAAVAETDVDIVLLDHAI